MPDEWWEVRMRVRSMLSTVLVLTIVGVGVGFLLGLVRPRGKWWNSDR